MPDDGCRGDRATQASRLARGARGQGPARRQRRGPHDLPARRRRARCYAIDNRCPHMGFPLHRGSVSDGILTCHWHHARFDLCTGGTFDQWADDLRRFPVEVEGDDVYVDVSPPEDPLGHQRQRLYDGLRLDIPLVVAKATIALADADPSGADVFAASLEFGALRRGGGWFRGLTTLTCLMNLVPRLEGQERAAALYHGATDVASDSAGMAPEVPARPAARSGERLDDAARPLVPEVHRGARRRRSRAGTRLGRARGCVARGTGGHALRGRDRPPLPRGRPHARLHEQGARGARPGRLGSRRGGADLAAAAARVRRADGGVEHLAQPGRPGRAARGRRSSACPLRGLRASGAAGRSWWRSCSAASRPRSSTRCSRRSTTAPARSSSPRRSRSRRRPGSLVSRPATSTPTGTPRCTRSRSRTPSSRGCGARRRGSCCAACSTRP